MAGKIVVEMSGEEQALLRSMRKVIAEQNKTEAGYKKTGRASDRAGKQAQKGFGASALAQLKSYAAGVVSISAAAGLVTSMFARMREEVQKAGDSIVQLADKRRALVQVSPTSAEFQKLEDIGDTLAKETGLGRGAAREVAFDAKSLRFLEIVRDIAESREVMDPAIASKAAGKIPEIYRGKVSPLGAINMALAAAEASAFNVEDFIRFLPAAAAGGQAAGSTPAQTAGMLSVIGGQFARGSSAADRMKAFGLKVSLEEGLAGKGIKGAFDALEAMPKEKRRGFLGESLELNELYNMIRANADAIGTRSREVQAALDKTGTAESVLARKQRIALDPTTRAGRKNIAQRTADRAAVAREIAREARWGRTALESRAARDRYITELDESGAGLAETTFADWYATAAGSLGLGARRTRGAGISGRTTGRAILKGGSPLAMIYEIATAAGRLKEAADGLSTASTDLSGAAGQLRAAKPPPKARRGAQLRERNSQRE